MKKVVMLSLIVCLLCTVIGCGGAGKGVETIIDASQFSRITPDELKQIMGEPENIENWTHNSGIGNLSVTSYYYNDGVYEFHIVDNEVTRLNVYPGDSEEFNFNKEEDLFKIFAIAIDERTTKTSDTGVALRFGPVSEEIVDFWISGIEGNKFYTAKITYNLKYFN